ncbi:hypothetical protein GCM10029963_11760 [Micromonospora andamanensis]
MEDLCDTPPGGTATDPDLDPVAEPDGTDVVLGCLPLGGRFGQAVALTGTFQAGATLVLLSRFTGPAALDLMLREEVTVFHGTSAMYAALLDAARERRALPRLRRCVSRAPLPPSLRQRFTITFDTVVEVAEGSGPRPCRTRPPAGRARPGGSARVAWAATVSGTGGVPAASAVARHHLARRCQPRRKRSPGRVGPGDDWRGSDRRAGRPTPSPTIRP